MTQFQKYISAQVSRIDIEKWLEGCNKGYDPGEEYVLAWIETQGKHFREAWDSSSCKRCLNNCRHLTKQKCSEFIEELNYEYHKTLDTCN